MNSIFVYRFLLGYGHPCSNPTHATIASCPVATWAIADTTPDTKITLAGQPKAKTLEYRVFARNKAGDGLPSNVIEVVL